MSSDIDFITLAYKRERLHVKGCNYVYKRYAWYIHIHLIGVIKQLYTHAYTNIHVHACIYGYIHLFWNILNICINFILWRDVWVALRQFQLWYAKPGLSCRPTCRIGCRISNTRVFKLPDFVHWGSYYWRQPGRQAGGHHSLRQLLSSGLELCPLALLQLLSYRAELWVLGTPYGVHTNWEQAMDSSFAHYQGKLTTQPFSYSVNWCTGL